MKVNKSERVQSPMAAKGKVQGFKGPRVLVKTLKDRYWDPRTLGPLNPLGLTFIEVMMAMAILGILAAVVIPKLDLTTVSSGTSVDGAAYIVASDIRYAQESAMATRVSRSVIFTSGSSTYTFNPGSSLDPSARLPSGVTISSNYTVTFNSLGEPITGGDGSVTVSAGGQTRTITVLNYTGKVNIS